jgi:hypothetical protein
MVQQDTDHIRRLVFPVEGIGGLPTMNFGSKWDRIALEHRVLDTLFTLLHMDNPGRRNR